MSEKMDLCGSLNWDPLIFIGSTLTKFIIQVRLPSDNIEENRYGQWTAMVYLLSGTTKRIADKERNIPVFLEFLVKEAKELAKKIPVRTTLEIFSDIRKVGEITIVDCDEAA
ncbi:MAG: hypothetical protein WC708_01060 [Lentisphaeria bacterium]|jgi:hypothetical protein